MRQQSLGTRRGAARAAHSALARRRRGFTIVELLISLIVSLVVVSSATAFAVTSWESRRGWTIRESVDRNARYVGMSLARDVQEAGIDIESTPVFGTLGTFGDTISVISVPYEPEAAPTYRFDSMDGDTVNPLPPGGNCGQTCLTFMKEDGTFNLQTGDLARLQINGTRRLLMVTNTNDRGTHFDVTYLDVSEVLGRGSALGDTILVDRFGTAIQKVRAVSYWHDKDTRQIMRAEQYSTANAAPIGTVIADGAEGWEARLIFMGDIEGPYYDGIDDDSTNNGDRVVALKVRAKIQADRTDPAVNNGEAVFRWYEWRVAPRNLMYEKNRL